MRTHTDYHQQQRQQYDHRQQHQLRILAIFQRKYLQLTGTSNRNNTSRVTPTTTTTVASTWPRAITNNNNTNWVGSLSYIRVYVRVQDVPGCKGDTSNREHMQLYPQIPTFITSLDRMRRKLNEKKIKSTIGLLKCRFKHYK